MIDTEKQIIDEISQQTGQNLEEDKFELNIPKMFTDNYKNEFDKFLKYTGNPKDIKQRLKHKILQIWLLWNRISQDSGLANSISNVPKDADSDEFRLKQSFLFVIEQIAYILSNTDIIEEIVDNEVLQKLHK
jgi:hypothetical protein